MKKTIYKVAVTTGYKTSALRRVYQDKHGDFYAKVEGTFLNVNHAEHRFIRADK